jgi:urease accessory protein
VSLAGPVDRGASSGGADHEVGKSGVLRLRLGPRGVRTVVVDQYWRIPLQVLPPSYQDDDDTAFVYLLNPTGGIVQGDRLTTEVTLEPGARALLTTQSATKVYRMVERDAEERNHFVVQDGAALEYLPDQTIPFAGSRLHRSTVVDLDPGATLILGDFLAAGRVARGERFGFDRLATDLVVRVGGEPRLVDRLHLVPSEIRPDRAGLWGGHPYFATLCAYSPRVTPALAGALAEVVTTRDRVHAGAGQPEPGFLVARALGPTTDELRQLLFEAWDVLRRALLGKPARRLRKF